MFVLLRSVIEGRNDSEVNVVKVVKKIIYSQEIHIMV